MTVRATARHRASVRPATAFSALTSAVTDHVGTIGRGGVVIAMSSGLVATMGMPAQAVGRNAGSEVAAVPATAPIAVSPAVAFQGGLMAAPAALDTSVAPLTAPAAATVSFESSAFKAVPKVVAPVSNLVHGSSAGSAGLPSVRSDLVSSFGSARGSSVLTIASRYFGLPYLYGGTSPSTGFDCSGATQYIYSQLGLSLPRTANDQMLATTRISRSEARPGDLVFFISGGRAYHVGIFAGGNRMVDSPRTGETYGEHTIFSATVVFGRVGA